MGGKGASLNGTRGAVALPLSWFRHKLKREEKKALKKAAKTPVTIFRRGDTVLSPAVRSKTGLG